MTESGEVVKPHTPFESFRLLEDRGYRVLAALGYQALAMRANNTTLAETYFDRSISVLETEEDCGDEHHAKVPYQPAVYARALLNLAPITRELVVNRRISEPEEVAAASGNFVKDLGKHARAAKSFLLDKELPDKNLQNQQGSLIAAFNALAVQGLLMRAQTDILGTNDWMALPAFVEPEHVRWEGGDLSVGIRWHVNIFGGSKANFDRHYKVYVRNSRYSQHEKMEDAETSVVWVATDLRLEDDHRFAVELDIIKDLESKTNRGRDKVRERADKLLDAIERTYGSIQTLPLKFTKPH